jgi:pimeloyl-ACP methyl ester carboxylesterase
MILRAALGVLLVLALGGCSSASSATTPRLTGSQPCPGSAGFTCSNLTVPLDHSGAQKGTLELAVAAENDVNAPRGVLLLITGGPGQPGLPTLGRLSRIVGAELKQYRVVVYDQRGTGGGALDCEALQAAMGSSDLYPPPASAVRACSRRLGRNRAFFGTDDVVADMDMLRAALGVKTWVLDGISYGTYVGERYALAHPDHVGKLVLDSVVPHAGLFDLGVVEFRAVARVLRDVCGTSSCTADLAAVVRARHDGPRLLDALTFDSIADPTYFTVYNVPTILRDARNGDPSELEQFLASVRGFEATPPDELDQGLHASALCADWRYPWGDSSAPLAGRSTKLARAIAKLPAASLYPFDRATAIGNGFIQQCLPWSPTRPTPLPPAGAKLQVPTLLVNGDHDLSTPLEWARQELRLAPKGRLVIVSGAGHGIQSRAVSDTGRNAVAAFLLG